MNEDVAGRDGSGLVGVGVGDTDKADALRRIWWIVRRASEEEEDMVDVGDEESKRRGKDCVDERGGVEGGRWWKWGEEGEHRSAQMHNCKEQPIDKDLKKWRDCTIDCPIVSRSSYGI